MHPPLFKPHPKCEEVVQALVGCHEERSIAKFWGACNEFKVALDRCFIEEKEDRRRANMNKARSDQALFEAKRPRDAL